MKDAFKKLLLISMLAVAAPTHAQSQAVSTYPDKPIQIVVPYVPGSSLDAIVRLIGLKLQDRIHQSVIVLNKPGAGGTVGAEYVARAEPDGYTLLSSTNGLAINASLYSKISFNPLRDLAPVTQMTSSPHVLVVPLGLKANNIPELIALAKSEPGKLNFAGGLGNSDHLSGELFKSMAHIDIVHIPYGGAPPALTDTISGRVQMFFSGVPAALPLIKAGKIKALGVTSAHPNPLLPDVPPIANTLPGFTVDLWYALLAPAKTPPAIVQKISADVRAVMQLPDVHAQTLKMGLEPVGSTPEQFKKFFDADAAKWAEIVKRIHLKLD